MKIEGEGVVVTDDTKQLWKENQKIQRKNEKELIRIQQKISSMKFKRYIESNSDRLTIDIGSSSRPIPGIAYLTNVTSATSGPVKKHIS